LAIAERRKREKGTEENPNLDVVCGVRDQLMPGDPPRECFDNFRIFFNFNFF
jgi:hypothetical protein